ncbi:type A chloramphenicol O-acetyltransferase [Desmospora activa]|uniref:Chloramphenicol acetyltransferase n=1 Tax=Desmospora activa DSM 45169 TaxID=1121389 RepID=A0A2T4Z9H1_9BACL|nr:type A chloramphenicol O-acetyltransferase [Desmospora activa]PTM58544.1 chloramphenicol O-acetyltransferase type A [Desmospora activa DSM 45169]
MNFYRIDLERWSRRPYFEHFMNENKCSFSLTANVNVTTLLQQLRNKNLKFYPAFIYMVSRVVNKHVEFRTAYNQQGQLGYWDQMIPNYTIFHKEDRSFSAIWTEYSSNFLRFYENYQHDMEQYGNKKGLWVKENVPANTFSISSLPWVQFTSFNLHLYKGEEYLLPIITNGKYFSAGKEILIPVSLQVHHAVCDGYHVSMFINDLQMLADRCEEWI